MRRGLALLAALAAAAALPGLARADGDPASDVLPTQDVYLPVSQPSADAAAALAKSVAEVYAGGDRVKVAVIATLDDMGSVPSLFNQPNEYARFLGTELSGFYVGPLLIAMPSGFGYYDGGRSTSAATAVLNGLSVSRSTVDAFVRSAAAAVDKLRAADALKSPDIKAPTAYPGLVTVHAGKPAKLTFRLFDDSERSSALVTIVAGSRVLATLHVAMQQAVYSKTLSLAWRAPKVLPRNLKLCLVATDPAGNRSPRSCLPIKVH